MIYRFADCEFDEGRRVLWRRGREQRVQPKVLDLLAFLLRHRARMIPKTLLFRELWPDATVTEASLTRLVKEARRAVGDDGRRQRVIRTVHGRGYRVSAEVAVANGGSDDEAQWTIELARRSLEAAVEFGSLDLSERVREFAETCLAAVEAARGPDRAPTSAVAH